MKQRLWIILTMLFLLLFPGGSAFAEDMTGEFGMLLYGYGSPYRLPAGFIYWVNDDWALISDIMVRFESGYRNEYGYSLGVGTLKVLAKNEVIRWETMLGLSYKKETYDSWDDYYIAEYEEIIYGAGVGLEYFFNRYFTLNCFLEYTGAEITSLYSDGSVKNDDDQGFRYRVFLRWY